MLLNLWWLQTKRSRAVAAVFWSVLPLLLQLLMLVLVNDKHFQHKIYIQLPSSTVLPRCVPWSSPSTCLPSSLCRRAKCQKNRKPRRLQMGFRWAQLTNLQGKLRTGGGYMWSRPRYHALVNHRLACWGMSGHHVQNELCFWVNSSHEGFRLGASECTTDSPMYCHTILHHVQMSIASWSSRQWS